MPRRLLTLVAVAAALLASACGNRLPEASVVAAARPQVIDSAAGAQPGTAAQAGTPATGQSPGASVQPQGSAQASAQGSSSPTGNGAGSDGPQPGQTGGSVAATCAPATGTPVALANLGSYSGVFGEVLHTAEPAIQAWAKATNACGGLGGHPIQMFIGDDGGDPSTALTLAQNYVQNHHVIAFVGSQIPLTFHTVINYLNSVNVPLVGGDTEDAGWYTNPMAFPQGGSIPLQAAGSLKMISADGHKKAAVYACIESSLCSQFVNLMKQEAPSYGVDVVTSGGVSLTQPSYTAQCLSAAGAKATALFVALDPSGLQRLTDDCQATGYSPAYYTISIGVTEADLTNRALNHMKWANMGFAYSDATDPAVAAYRQAMQAYASAGASVGGPSASAWASGQLVRAAASRLSPTPTAQDIINGLWALKDATLGGLVPPLTFPRGKPPIVAQCFWQMEILNGAFASPTAGASTCL